MAQRVSSGGTSTSLDFFFPGTLRLLMCMPLLCPQQQTTFRSLGSWLILPMSSRWRESNPLFLPYHGSVPPQEPHRHVALPHHARPDPAKPSRAAPNRTTTCQAAP